MVEDGALTDSLPASSFLASCLLLGQLDRKAACPQDHDLAWLGNNTSFNGMHLSRFVVGYGTARAGDAQRFHPRGGLEPMATSAW